MSKKLPPIDLHAHIDPRITGRSLEELGAVVFAASRSLEEYELVVRRNDQVTIWGVGCHPDVRRAQESFDSQWFTELIQRTAFVGEIGLDGSSKVPINMQEETFKNILECLSKNQRIASIHSRKAVARVLQLLEEQPVKGAILHWWCGNNHQTAHAIELGCWFSVNISVRNETLASIPLNRLFVETDHPYGNLKSKSHRQPGGVLDIEQRLANIHDLSPEAIRSQIWDNFVKLIEECHLQKMMTRPISRMIEHHKTHLI